MGLQVSFKARLLVLPELSELSELYLYYLIWHSAVEASRPCSITLVDFVGIQVVGFDKMIKSEVGLCVNGVLLKAFGASKERA